ncbi:hypothetical protein A2398_04890 [Candidatus Peribacteria bacterium RIFOXYB1_FULL_57_12]|nr:MAG: hypothetical protein A2398_04890 [Candidatus Peribacteria bacterium RIFOXYB1_FULL_57_12]
MHNISYCVFIFIFPALSMPSLQEELTGRLARLENGGAGAPQSHEVGRFAYEVKIHCGFISEENREKLKRLGLESYIDGDVKDGEPETTAPDLAAELAAH